MLRCVLAPIIAVTEAVSFAAVSSVPVLGIEIFLVRERVWSGKGVSSRLSSRLSARSFGAQDSDSQAQEALIYFPGCFSQPRTKVPQVFFLLALVHLSSDSLPIIDIFLYVPT